MRKYTAVFLFVYVVLGIVVPRLAAGETDTVKNQAGPKIKIFCDMEGISGIRAWVQVRHENPRYGETHKAATLEQSFKGENPRYREGQRYLMGDINACIQGCFEGGASKVLVQDIHATCDNIIWDLLDQRAECTVGRVSRFQGIEEFDGLILLGYHTMAGTPKGILAHTSSSATWKNCWMNGVKVGEFALEAVRAGEHGVPVIMTTGDHLYCEEAKSFIPTVLTVEVKKAMGTEAAILQPQSVAHRKIRDGAATAVRNLQTTKPKPYTVSTPVTMRLEKVDPPTFPGANRQKFKIINQRTYEVTAETAMKAIGLLF